MQLGFDATTVQGNKTGVGYYTTRLLDRLTRVGGHDNPIDEVLVLSNRARIALRVPRARVLNSGHFPLRAPWMQGILPWLLGKHRPDLCHFTNFLAPAWSEIPFVVTIHDMTLQLLPQHHTWKKRLLTASLMPRIANQSRLIITPSESAREDVSRLFDIPRSKIRAIPHAADPRFRPMRDRASWNSVADRHGLQKPYLLYVGTIEPRKNLLRAVTAFARARRRYPELRFYLVGELGWHSAPLLSAIDALRLGESVRRLGYVDEDDLPALYSNAELFVYPSLYEGFGFPVLEAMACGAPVLTSRTSSLTEIGHDAALLVDPENLDELTEIMAYALSRPSERDSWVSAGLARARSFSWERTARETLEVYEEALERPIARARAREPDEGASERLLAQAVVDTLAYGGLFDFPMRLDEIHRSLLKFPMTRENIAELLSSDPRVASDPPFYYLKDAAFGLEDRERKNEATQRLLRQHRRVLELVRTTPFVRMVALSGATAHGNAADGDIDLFVVTSKNKAWAVSLLLFVAMKLLGLRRAICLNYLIGEDQLALSERDGFTAHQIVSLRPLAGHHAYYRFVRANRWGSRYYPNFWQHFRRFEPIPDPSPRAGCFWLETILRPGPGSLLERLGRWLLGSHLWRQYRRAGSPGSVKLRRGTLKLHFTDHAEELAKRIETFVDRSPTELEAVNGRPEGDHASLL